VSSQSVAGKVRATAAAITLLVVVQLARYGLKETIFPFVGRTDLGDRVASFVAMAVLTVVIIALARWRKVPISFLPDRFSVSYVVFTCLFAAFLISTPLVTQDASPSSVFLLLYSGIVVPVFEETLFRGVLWNYLSGAFHRQLTVYVVVTVLFALWHLGYVDTLAFHTGASGDRLANIMMWKSVTGLYFGVVLGALRLKTRNCYSTMLLHGALNVFAG